MCEKAKTGLDLYTKAHTLATSGTPRKRRADLNKNAINNYLRHYHEISLNNYNESYYSGKYILMRFEKQSKKKKKPF